MAYYRSLGNVPRTRHIQFRDEKGSLWYEELMGEEGFDLDSSLIYHRNIPPALVDARKWDLPDQSLTPNDVLVNRHLKLHDLFTPEQADLSDAVLGRRLLLGNDDVRINYAWVGKTSPLYRNGIGDELVFIEEGEARLETVFGPIDVRHGDQVVIPRATTHRWVIEPGKRVRMFLVEANSHITPPKRYMSRYGQLLEHAPFCERDLRGPTELMPMADFAGEKDVEVYVKHRGGGANGLAGTVQVVPHHPFDVVGWDGCLYPFVLNVDDFMPLTGKVHQPPPTHQAFEGFNFVVCDFVPRKMDYHPLAVPVPYYHSNVDADEVMFYAGGEYEARKGSGIGVGSVSVHPGGYPHGPQPGAVEASLGKDYFDELGFMVDTFRPLWYGEAALACEDRDYRASWSGRWEGREVTFSAPVISTD